MWLINAAGRGWEAALIKAFTAFFFCRIRKVEWPRTPTQQLGKKYETHYRHLMENTFSESVFFFKYAAGHFKVADVSDEHPNTRADPLLSGTANIPFITCVSSSADRSAPRYVTACTKCVGCVREVGADNALFFKWYACDDMQHGGGISFPPCKQSEKLCITLQESGGALLCSLLRLRLLRLPWHTL